MPRYALGNLSPDVAPDAYVHPDAVLIGAVTIGPGSSVWPCAVLRADSDEIRIGEGTSVQDGVVIHTADGLPTIVGNDVTIGHLAHLEGCTVEDGALIGVNASVLHRAVVGSHSLVGAGAVVTPGTMVPAHAMALGVPARIRSGAVAADAFESNLRSYRDLSGRYREGLRRLPD